MSQWRSEESNAYMLQFLQRTYSQCVYIENTTDDVSQHEASALCVASPIGWCWRLLLSPLILHK